MKTRISVALNGQYLHELDDTIVTQSVNIAAPQLTRYTAEVPGNGAFCGTVKRKMMEVRVGFSIISKRDFSGRVETYNKVMAWAMGGGMLTTTGHDGKFLQVVCDALPDLGSVRDWTRSHEITFRAYTVPYWQDEAVSEVSGRVGASAPVTMTLPVGGTADTPLNVTALVRSGTMNSLTVTVGKQRIGLTGLNAIAGEAVTIATDEHGFTDIFVTGIAGTRRNALSCRTKASHDELTVSPGAASVEVICGADADVTLSARGRWV